MLPTIAKEWGDLLAPEMQKDYYQNLMKFLQEEYATKVIYPPKEKIFTALTLTPFAEVKVVLLGQDPYHEEGQAQGMSFSVPTGTKLPPSLRNIYKEIAQETGQMPCTDGDLTRWAQQGVLLLNTVLTVRSGHANSHKNKGWELFTDRIISLLNARVEPLVFLLWGNNAKTKAELITNKQHLVLTSVHPSPLSAYGGFFGCGHFTAANEFLRKTGQEEIVW